jgi:hypothetical protein
MKDTAALGMYNRAVQSMADDLVFDAGDGMAFLAEKKSRPIKEMEHLSCFVPGMLSLGASLFSSENSGAQNINHAGKNRAYRSPEAASERELAEKSESQQKLAEKILAGCIFSYNRMPTGLAPERFSFEESRAKYNRIQVKEGKYILRPETVESVFVLYRLTKDPKYKEMGWKIFKAIEAHCRVDCCYSGVKDVSRPPDKLVLNNSMQSFFLAETLKYLYLLFADEDVIPLDKYVFTTEAHPLPIFSRRQNN